MVTVTVFPATTVVGLAEMFRTGWAAAGAATATQIAAAASAIVAVLASVRRRLRRGRSIVMDKVGLPPKCARRVLVTTTDVIRTLHPAGHTTPPSVPLRGTLFFGLRGQESVPLRGTTAFVARAGRGPLATCHPNLSGPSGQTTRPRRTDHATTHIPNTQVSATGSHSRIPGGTHTRDRRPAGAVPLTGQRADHRQRVRRNGYHRLQPRLHPHPADGLLLIDRSRQLHRRPERDLRRLHLRRADNDQLRAVHALVQQPDHHHLEHHRDQHHGNLVPRRNQRRRGPHHHHHRRGDRR